MTCNNKLEIAPGFTCGHLRVDDKPILCFSCRLDELEKNSHPPKPCLDPDSFEEWRQEFERRMNSELKQIRRQLSELLNKNLGGEHQ